METQVGHHGTELMCMCVCVRACVCARMCVCVEGRASRGGVGGGGETVTKCSDSFQFPSRATLLVFLLPKKNILPIFTFCHLYV